MNRMGFLQPAPKNVIKKNFTCEIHRKWGVFTLQPCSLSWTILSRDDWGKKHGKVFYEGLDRKRTHHVTALIAHFGAGCRKPDIVMRFYDTSRVFQVINHGRGVLKDSRKGNFGGEGGDMSLMKTATRRCKISKRNGENLERYRQ